MEKRKQERERKKEEERRIKMARASRFMIRYKISLIALHGLLIKPPPPSRLGLGLGLRLGLRLGWGGAKKNCLRQERGPSPAPPPSFSLSSPPPLLPSPSPLPPSSSPFALLHREERGEKIDGRMPPPPSHLKTQKYVLRWGGGG